MQSGALSAPPEGAIVGESVPRENEENAIEEALIEKVANHLKTHPAWSGRSDQERREKARRLLEEHE